MKPSCWRPVVYAALLCLIGAGHSHGQSGNGNIALPVLPVTVLKQSPAETKTELQIICLFRSSPQNTLHGSLVETNEKLHGQLDGIRKPGLFGGEVGETILLTPSDGALGAKRLLIIGLGDADSFSPQRMVLIGKIAMREANRLAIAHPFFAPTILDGGVTRYTTGEISEQVVRGLREALATEAALRSSGTGGQVAVRDFTYLAGPKFAQDTQDGIDRGLGAK